MNRVRRLVVSHLALSRGRPGREQFDAFKAAVDRLCGRHAPARRFDPMLAHTGIRLFVLAGGLTTFYLDDADTIELAERLREELPFGGPRLAPPPSDCRPGHRSRLGPLFDAIAGACGAVCGYGGDNDDAASLVPAALAIGGAA